MVSPSSNSTRISRPAIGAATTNLSCARVSPSSSTVTRRGPRVTLAVSTLMGDGRRRKNARAATTTKNTATNHLRCPAFCAMSFPRLEDFDQIEIPQPPINDGPSGSRGRGNDQNRESVRASIYDQRHAIQLGLHRRRERRANPVAKQKTNWYGDQGQERLFSEQHETNFALSKAEHA